MCASLSLCTKELAQFSDGYFLLLFAGPSGAPEFLPDKISTSSDSLSVVWRPPPRSSLNGEFMGYEMSWRREGANAAAAKTASINEDVMRVQVRAKIVDLFPQRMGIKQQFESYCV